MTSIALMTFFGSLFIFCVLFLLVRAEQKRGKRFFLTGFRSWLDRVVFKIEASIAGKIDHFVRYILQLHWYYSIHSILRGLLQLLVAVYTYFEKLFEKNRRRTKALRKERNEKKSATHLDHIAEHKAETALTPAQQRKLRKKKLEERN